MTHIKTPVRAIDTATETLIWDAEDELLAIGSGDAQGKLEIGEIVTALNERGVLIAQRDALVAACESVLESMDIATEGFGDSIANGMFKGAFLGVRKQIADALALTQEDQCTDVPEGDGYGP